MGATVVHVKGLGSTRASWHGAVIITSSAVAVVTGVLAPVIPVQADTSPSAMAGTAVVSHRSDHSPHGRDPRDSDPRAACAHPAKLGQMACMALLRTVAQPRRGAAPAGYGPTTLQHAYNLNASRGSGQTVAIAEAYDDPNAESDLATYRSTYGLPACTAANGCFRKVGQNGGTSYPSADAGWAADISLDLDMVSAICPNCHILLVEASSSSISDLGTAVNRAVSLGARFVSVTWGRPEDSSDPSYDSKYFNHPGVAITASAGDSGYGLNYPATSRYVTAVGGTTLAPSDNARGWTETPWNGNGFGCSAYEAKPAWQKDISTGCARRSVADVAAVADPDTGVAVYDSYQASLWGVFGGTSAASPIIAAVYALAGTPTRGTYPASYPYAHAPSGLHFLTSGKPCGPSYPCRPGPGHSGPGYNPATGLGTPDGSTAFAAP